MAASSKEEYVKARLKGVNPFKDIGLLDVKEYIENNIEWMMETDALVYRAGHLYHRGLGLRALFPHEEYIEIQELYERSMAKK